MPTNKVYVNKQPTLPPRYCRYCGKRIQAVYPTECVRLSNAPQTHFEKDEQGRWIMRYTGEAHYKRSEFFCTQTHAEIFAELMARNIDNGMKPAGKNTVWTAITLGKGEPK